jgi:hypothetical protein
MKVEQELITMDYPEKDYELDRKTEICRYVPDQCVPKRKVSDILSLG